MVEERDRKNKRLNFALVVKTQLKKENYHKYKDIFSGKLSSYRKGYQGFEEQVKECENNFKELKKIIL